MASLLSGPKKENGRLRGIVPLKEGTPRPGLAMGSFHKKRTEPLGREAAGSRSHCGPIVFKSPTNPLPSTQNLLRDCQADMCSSSGLIPSG